MQTTTDKWKQMYDRNLINETFLDISFGIGDPDAEIEASVTDNGKHEKSQSSNILSEIPKKEVAYHTIERNLWKLDGSMIAMPDQNHGYIGFWSDTLSGEDGSFDINPTITVSFPAIRSIVIPGITVRFSDAYDEFASEFHVNVYKGDSLVSTNAVSGNTDSVCYVRFDIRDYDKISITISKWCLPNRRARISSIYIGIDRIYSKQDLMQYTHEMASDPICASIPSSKINFSLFNFDGKFDPDNEEGDSKYLVQRQRMRVRYGMKHDDGSIEYISGGIFYLSEWDSDDNGIGARFTARDITEFMGDIYRKGLYRSDGISLYDLAIAVMQDTNIPSTHTCFLSESLKTIKTYSYLPVCTKAECLQMIAQAGQCAFFFDRESNIHIDEVNEETPNYAVTNFNMFERPSIELQTPVSRVLTKSYTYITDASDAEIASAQVEINGEATVWIDYNDPATNVRANVSGATVIQSSFYTNACEIKLSGTGTAKITIIGNRLSASSVDIPFVIGDQGESQPIDNPLITSNDHAYIVGKWVGSYLSKRKTISVNSFRADPRIDPIDTAYVDGKYDKREIIVSSVKINYNGAFRGSVEGRELA